MVTGHRSIIFFLVLIVALISIGLCMSQANALEVDYPPGEDNIVPLALGEPAPFDGQLFSTDTAIRWGFRVQRLRLQLEQDVAREREICAAQDDLSETKARLEQENHTFQLQTLRGQLEREHQVSAELWTRLVESSDIPWYKSWTFGLIVGVVTAGTIAGLGIWLF